MTNKLGEEIIYEDLSLNDMLFFTKINNQKWNKAIDRLVKNQNYGDTREKVQMSLL